LFLPFFRHFFRLDRIQTVLRTVLWTWLCGFPSPFTGYQTLAVNLQSERGVTVPLPYSARKSLSLDCMLSYMITVWTFDSGETNVVLIDWLIDWLSDS
jgi:hypothetical protein